MKNIRIPESVTVTLIVTCEETVHRNEIVSDAVERVVDNVEFSGYDADIDNVKVLDINGDEMDPEEFGYERF